MEGRVFPPDAKASRILLPDAQCAHLRGAGNAEGGARQSLGGWSGGGCQHSREAGRVACVEMRQKGSVLMDRSGRVMIYERRRDGRKVFVGRAVDHLVGGAKCWYIIGICTTGMIKVASRRLVSSTFRCRANLQQIRQARPCSSRGLSQFQYQRLTLKLSPPHSAADN